MNAHLPIGKVSADMTISILSSRPTSCKPYKSNKKQKYHKIITKMIFPGKADQLLEEMIDEARKLALTANSKEAASNLWMELLRLIKLRSPQQIKKMEERMKLI